MDTRFTPKTYESIELQIGEIPLSYFIAPHPAISLIHRISNSNFGEFGIYEGDILILEKGRMPLDGNWLLLRNETGIYIQIFSKKDIHTLQNSGEIIGIITANIRKYIE